MKRMQKAWSDEARIAAAAARAQAAGRTRDAKNPRMKPGMGKPGRPGAHRALESPQARRFFDQAVAEEERRAARSVIIPAKFPQEQFQLFSTLPGTGLSRGGKDRLRGIREIGAMRREGWLKPRAKKQILTKYVLSTGEAWHGGRDASGAIILPPRTPIDHRLGRTPLEIGDMGSHQVRLPVALSGPHHAVPPNWADPAGGAGQGQSAEEPGVTVFSSHHGEGRQPRVPAWRYGI